MSTVRASDIVRAVQAISVRSFTITIATSYLKIEEREGNRIEYNVRLNMAGQAAVCEAVAQKCLGKPSHALTLYVALGQTLTLEVRNGSLHSVFPQFDPSGSPIEL